MKYVNTVAGKVSSDDLGVTLMHDHLVFAQVGWQSDITVAAKFIDHDAYVKKCVDFIEELKGYGLNTLFNPTPSDGYRMPELMKEVSEKTGVNIIATTGMYDEGGGGSNYWKFRMPSYDIVEELYETFMTELTVGMEGTGIKAGAIKVATSAHKITPFEKCVLTAAARASRDTGAVITTHTALGTMGKEQAEIFLAEGVDPNRVVIGHMCDCLDPDYHEYLFKQGFSVGFDRFGLEGGQYGCPTDAERYTVLVELIKRGYANRINLSSDSTVIQPGRPTDEFWKKVPNCNPVHVFRDVIPDLKKLGVTEAEINAMLIDNPRHVFES